MFPGLTAPDGLDQAQQSPPTSPTPTNQPFWNHEQAQQHSETQNNNLGRGFREKFPNVRHRDYVTHTIFTRSPSPTSSNTLSPKHPSGTPYPIAHYINCNSFSLRYQTFIAAIISGKEPRSFKEAMTNEGWRKSMQEEI